MKKLTAKEAREIKEKFGSHELQIVMNLIFRAASEGMDSYEYKASTPLASETINELVELGYNVMNDKYKNNYKIEW